MPNIAKLTPLLRVICILTAWIKYKKSIDINVAQIYNVCNKKGSHRREAYEKPNRK